MLHQSTISETSLRPTHVVVRMSAIEHNFLEIKRKVGTAKLLAVLKANAYGHGLLPIARKLESLGADYFGVAYLEEGVLLRENGIRTPILVMGGIVGEQIPLFIKYNLTITASSVDKLRHIDDTAKKMGVRAKAHLKIDTGMERIGIHYYSALKLIEAYRACEHTVVEGIFTHYAYADHLSNPYSKLQFQRFNQVLALLKNKERDRLIIHSNNSGAIFHSGLSNYTMVRIGLLLYGVLPSLEMKNKIDIEPALSWKTKVVFFKVVAADHPISYGGIYAPPHATRVVTLPVGYGDGFMRSMSNKIHVLIRGKKYPQVGNICMDQCMIDIGNGTAYNGDEVILIGNQGTHQITVENLAKHAGTIPYEILTNINTRVPRVYV